MKFINRDVALACFDDWTDLNGDVRSAEENPVYKKIKALPTVDLIFDGEEEKMIMDIDEAILHCEEVADRCMITDGNIKCGNDHRQLAEWLKDYKELKLLATAIKPKWKAEDRYVKNRFFMFPYCPKCGDEIMPRDCYCKFCGQHIDWSEDDE